MEINQQSRNILLRMKAKQISGKERLGSFFPFVVNI
jgi:hypothetical protein